MLGSYYLHHLSPGLHEFKLPLHLALYPIALIVLSSAFLALTTFFLVATYTAGLRRYLSEERQIQFPARGGRIGIRLAVAFSATALVPAMILLAHAGDPFTRIERLEGEAHHSWRRVLKTGIGLPSVGRGVVVSRLTNLSALRVRTHAR